MAAIRRIGHTDQYRRDLRTGQHRRGMLLGLATGASLSLLDNNGDYLPLSANGGFVFPTALVAGIPPP